MVRRKTGSYDMIQAGDETPKPLDKMVTSTDRVHFDYSWVDKRVFRFWDVRNAANGLMDCFLDDMEFTGSEIKGFIKSYFKDVCKE